MANTDATSVDDVATLESQIRQLATLLSETRNLFPGIRQQDVADAWELDVSRIRDIEGAWKGDRLVNTALSFRLADYLAGQAADQVLERTKSDAVLQGCEKIRGQAEIVRNQLRDGRRNELGSILSVVDPEELAPEKLYLAFALRELRKINNKAQKDIVEKVKGLTVVSLQEYEHAIGYQIGDLLLIREIIAKFPCPNSSYEYIYQDLTVSVDYLYQNSGRSASQAAQRLARVDQQANRTPETRRLGRALRQTEREASEAKQQELLDFAQRTPALEKIIKQVYSGQISSVEHYLVAEQMVNTLLDELDPGIVDDSRTTLSEALQKLEEKFRTEQSSYVIDLPYAERDDKTRLAWLLNQAIAVVNISGARNEILAENSGANRSKFLNPTNYADPDLLEIIALFINDSPGIPVDIRNRALDLANAILDEVPDAPPRGDTQIVGAAIATGRKSYPESRDEAARFLANALNHDEFNYYRNFIMHFEPHGRINTFDGVYCATLLLNRYVTANKTLNNKLTEYREILNRRATQLRNTRAAEILATRSLPLRGGKGSRKEILRGLGIAISLRHAREVARLKPDKLADAINDLARERGITLGNERLTEEGQLYYLENTAQYNLRQLGIAQLFLQICQVPEGVDNEGRDLIHRAVIAHVTERSRRPPRRIRPRRRGEESPDAEPRGAADTRYDALATVRDQLKAELRKAGFSADDFFPYANNQLREREREIDADRRVELLGSLRANTTLFPEITRAGLSWDDAYGEEVGYRAYIALTLSKLRLTSNPSLTRQQLATNINARIYDQNAWIDQKDIGLIENATWPYLPPEDTISRTLITLSADQETIARINESILDLNQIKQRGTADVFETDERSIPADPLEDLNYSLEIFSWLAAIHLEHRYLQSDRQNDYIAAFAAEAGIDEDQLRHLLNPLSRNGQPADARLTDSNEIVDRWRAANAVSQRIVAHVEPISTEQLPGTQEGRAGNQLSDEYRTMWLNIGRLASVHAEHLGGTLPSDAQGRDSFLDLLRNWQETLEATRLAPELGSPDTPELEPTGPAPFPQSRTRPSPAWPTTEVKSPAPEPISKERTTATEGLVLATGKPHPSQDLGGWRTYGWLHRFYRGAHWLSLGTVADRIGLTGTEVAQMEHGKETILGGTRQKGVELKTIVARTAAAAEHARIHGSVEGLELIDRPGPEDGWFYTGRLLKTIREDLDESPDAVAGSHRFTREALEAIEGGEGNQHRTELAALLSFYSTILRQQRLERSRSFTRADKSGPARGGDGTLPQPSPPGFKPGYSARAFPGSRRTRAALR